MSIELKSGKLVLEANGIALARHARGTRLAVVHGSAWLTIGGETRDVVLNAGDAFKIESDADVAISAIAGSVELAVEEAAPAVAIHPLAALLAALRPRRRTAPAGLAGAALESA